MSSIRLTESLKREYEELYDTCEIRADRFDRVDRAVNDILPHRPRYEEVAGVVGAPWYLVAVIHNMESSLSFAHHLHNGDPLTARTRHVPAGRPAEGEPPFTWEVSASDALRLRRIDRISDWPLPRLLYELEGYNGWGYRGFHAHVKSPYLWSFSNHYTRGKYVADGTWSETAVSKQCGAAVILRRLEERGEIDLRPARLPAKPPLRYASRILARGDDLQRFLNTFDGITLRVDGWPGEKTSDAVENVFGFRLQGDPREKK